MQNEDVETIPIYIIYNHTPWYRWYITFACKYQDESPLLNASVQRTGDKTASTVITAPPLLAMLFLLTNSLFICRGVSLDSSFRIQKREKPEPAEMAVRRYFNNGEAYSYRGTLR